MRSSGWQTISGSQGCMMGQLLSCTGIWDWIVMPIILTRGLLVSMFRYVFICTVYNSCLTVATSLVHGHPSWASKPWSHHCCLVPRLFLQGWWIHMVWLHIHVDTMHDVHPQTAWELYCQELLSPRTCPDSVAWLYSSPMPHHHVLPSHPGDPLGPGTTSGCPLPYLRGYLYPNYDHIHPRETFTLLILPCVHLIPHPCHITSHRTWSGGVGWGLSAIKNSWPSSTVMSSLWIEDTGLSTLSPSWRSPSKRAAMTVPCSSMCCPPQWFQTTLLPTG